MFGRAPVWAFTNLHHFYGWALRALFWRLKRPSRGASPKASTRPWPGSR